MTTGPGIKYVSLYDPSGYGEAARRCLLGLKRLGAPLTWTPMRLGSGAGAGLPYEPFTERSIGDPELDELCNRPIPYEIVVVHMVPEYYPYWSARERGKRIVGSTVWETDRAPGHWPALLNAVDLLLVPCEWNREVFRESGVSTPIGVVPHCLDPDGSQPDCWSDGVEKDDFVFYTVNVWSERKAVWNTLEAFLRTFSANEPAALVIKTSEEDLTSRRIPFTNRCLRRAEPAARRILRRYKRPAKVRIITETLSREQIRALHRRGDCYVSLCRSEGWGLGAFDAAAVGNPVVMTGYGGQLEYLREDLACLVDYRLEPLRARWRERSYTSDQRWAAPDLGHASRLMRSVFEQRGEARRRAEELGQLVREKWSCDAVAKQFLDSIWSPL